MLAQGYQEYSYAAEKYYFLRCLSSLRLVLVTRKWTINEFILHETIMKEMADTQWDLTDLDLSSDWLAHRILGQHQQMERLIYSLRRQGPYF